MVGKTSFRKAYHSAKTVNATVHVATFLLVFVCTCMYLPRLLNVVTYIYYFSY